MFILHKLWEYNPHVPRLNKLWNKLWNGGRTNYEIFNIRFQGTKIWNSIAESTKSLPLSKFKKKNKEKMIEKY